MYLTARIYGLPVPAGSLTLCEVEVYGLPVPGEYYT